MALDEESAKSRALLMAGLGMMGQPNMWAALSRGGLFGAQGYDNAIEQQRKLQDDALAQQMRDLQIKQLGLQVGQAQDWDSAMKQLSARMGGGAPAGAPARPAAKPSMMDAPDWAVNAMNPAAPNAAPSVKAAAPVSVGGTPSLGTPANNTDAMLHDLALRFPDKVKAIFDAQRAGEGKVYGDIQIDSAGKPYVMTERGPQYVNGGIVPREKLVPVDTGGSIGFRTEYSPKVVGAIDKTMSPSESSSDAIARSRLAFETGMGAGGGGAPRVAPAGGGSGPQPGTLGSGSFDGMTPKGRAEVAQSTQAALAKGGVDYKTGLDSTVSAGNDLMMRIAESRDALKQFQPGMGAEARLQVARAAQALNMPDALVERINAGDVSAKQEFIKLSAQQAMESLKQAMGGSGRITQAEFKVFQANNPNLELDPRAIEKIFEFTQRAHTRNVSEQSALGDYLQSGGNISQWPSKWTQMSGAGIQKKDAPKIGSVQDGFAYIGGDPAKPASWKKMQ